MTSKSTGQACGLDPSTRVLTADLHWIAIADVEVGQELVAYDAHLQPGRGNGCRKMRTAVVESVWRTSAPAYRITVDDGRVVICGATQRWLSQKRERQRYWRSIAGSGRFSDGRDQLKPGDRVRAIALPWGAPDPQDGWFGGIIDGEGSFQHRQCMRLSVYQCAGPVLVGMSGHCIARRYVHWVASCRPDRPRLGKRPVHALHIAGTSNLFRVLGLSRPLRFIAARWWEGKLPPHNGWRTITAVEPLGEIELAAMRTSTRTYIAEGFITHDST